MAAASLSISALTHHTLSISFTPKPISFSNPNPKPITSLSLSTSFPTPSFGPLVSSRFVRHVSVSSEIEEYEGTDKGTDEEGIDEGPRRQKQQGRSSEFKLFVGNLPFSVDSAQLAGLFEAVGSVETVEVVYDKYSGSSKGFGFVTMSTVEDVEAAAERFNGYVLEGRALRVNAGPPPPKTEGSFTRSPSRGGSSFGSNNRVHVRNLSWNVDDLALKTLFSEHGEVVEARIIYDRETGRSRGFGFVTFNSAEEANNAVEILDGVELLGREIRVSIAEPRRQWNGMPNSPGHQY